MTESELIKDLCGREIAHDLYDVKIDGVSIYGYMRRDFRSYYMAQCGFPENIAGPESNQFERAKNFFYSLFQILCLLVRKKKIENFIYPFYRIDKVGGIYVDKFTDPLIDYSDIGKSYIIFERGRNGIHYRPRKHSDRVVRVESISKLVRMYAKFAIERYKQKYENEYSILWSRMEGAFPEVFIDDRLKNWYMDSIYCLSMEARVYGKIFKRLGVKRFWAPSRADFSYLIPESKKRGIKVYELQHAAFFDWSRTYSGFQDINFVPDYFLSFSKIEIPSHYGTETSRIRTIGWAFDNYVKVLKRDGDNEVSKKVLMVSSHAITEQMVSVSIQLATANPNMKFYFRPHPNEQLTVEQISSMNNLPNLFIDDNSENILVALSSYGIVLGVRSNVVYEALQMGKKVGKLYMEGLQPDYMSESDKCLFGQIYDNESFQEFVNKEGNGKRTKGFYLEYDKFLMESILRECKE